MAVKGWRNRLGEGIVGVLLVAGIPWFGWSAEVAPDLPVQARGAEGLSVDRAGLEDRIRQELHLRPDGRVEIGNLPRHFHGPSGNRLSAELTNEGPEERGEYLFRLNILENGVARESFYLHVKVSGETAPGPVVLSRREGAEGSVREEGALVHSGDMVRVTVTGRGFLIRFSGIAQGGGFAGDRIPVVNPVSGRSLTGRITGHDQVMIGLSGGS